VIDLDGNRNELIQEIIKASQEYGFFQLRNHGVSEELMKDVLVVAKEFFDLPVEEKERFYSEDPNQTCRIKTSLDFAKEKVHFWRDNLRHPCHPLEEHIRQWPENPARYREVFGLYSVEVRKLGLRILDLICEGLGLEAGYFRGGLSHGQTMSINHYPQCPDPTLVLGLPKHGDPFTITLLNQGDVPGLQVLKDEKWVAIEPIPNAFVVNINHMLQIISNGKLKSADHRVVASSNIARTTVVSFITPSIDVFIEPAKSLVSESNPPLYKCFTFGDFTRTYMTDTNEGKDPLERLMIQS
jgi:isopenicillin N synthase-like dioxygenase